MPIRTCFAQLFRTPSSFRRRAWTAVALLPLAALPAQARSAGPRGRSRVVSHLQPLVASAVLLPGTLPAPDTDFTMVGQEYRLNLHHLHTGESLSLVYRIGNTYIPSAIETLNHFLRDHRTDDVSSYDPTEFDLLHNLMARLGKTRGEIEIVCGYRTPQSNEYLRDLGPNTGVAEHSQHVLAKAIDIRVPGVPTARLRNAALSLEAGGVGYYPKSQFVHVDVGPVRQWSFGGGSSRAHGARKRRPRRKA